MSMYRIGDVSQELGLSADTLRYYERIGLLPAVGRTAAGVRLYSNKDLSRLKFIQRAQKMNFTLAEITDLLKMRDDPQRARDKVRRLATQKLSQVELHLKELKTLRDELQLLLNLCRRTAAGCPIIEGIDRQHAARRRPRR